MGELTDEQVSTLIEMRRASAILSVLASLLVILCFACLRQARSASWRLVLLLAVSTAANGFVDAMGNPDGTGCVLQAAFSVFFDLTVAGWVFCIALNVYLVVVRSVVEADVFFKYYAMGVYGVATVVALVPFAGDDVYGPSGTWCFVRTERLAPWAILLYLPIFAVFFAVTVLFVLVGMAVRSTISRAAILTDNQEGVNEMRKVLHRLALYPPLFLLCWVPYLILRLDNIVSPDDPKYGLFLVASILGPLQGLFNSVYYGFDTNLRRFLAGKCTECREGEPEDMQPIHPRDDGRGAARESVDDGDSDVQVMVERPERVSYASVHPVGDTPDSPALSVVENDGIISHGPSGSRRTTAVDSQASPSLVSDDMVDVDVS